MNQNPDTPTAYTLHLSRDGIEFCCEIQDGDQWVLTSAGSVVICNPMKAPRHVRFDGQKWVEEKLLHS